MNRIFGLFGTACVAITLSTATANASLLTWNWTPATGGGFDVGVSNSAGEIKSVNATFNTATLDFTWYATFGSVPGHSTWKTDGFTLAVNNGPNPKGHPGELALLYFDATGSSPTLSVYGYNGLNAVTSYYDGKPQSGTQTPDRILTTKTNTSWVSDLTNDNNGDGTRTLGFSINVKDIKSYIPINQGPNGLADWFGLGFDDSLGVWMHPFAKLTTSYNANGFLTSWDPKAEGYLDGRDFTTVPEPATLGLLAMTGLAMIRRRRAALA